MTLNRSEVEASVTPEMEGILSSLANRDAIKIFYAARDGITSSTKTIKELELTQKRYYTRLNTLMKAGLIEKTENAYNHTLLGKLLFYTLFKRLKNALINRDLLDLADKLKNSTSLSLKEREQVAAAISEKSALIGYTDLFGDVKPVEVVQTYEDLVTAVIKLIEKAEREIFFASRYTDFRISDPILRAFDRGIKFSLLDGDKSNLSSRMQMLRLILSNPKTVKHLYELINSPDIRIKYVNLPYSFIVVDKKYACVELINPITNSFSFAFFFNSEAVCKKLIRTFKALYEKAGESPFIELFAKKLKS